MLCLLRVLALAVPPVLVHAQPMRGAIDARIMREARLVASSRRVDLYVHGASTSPDLAAASDRAITQMEAILGRPWDSRTFGERMRLYVSSETRSSHVLGGYESHTLREGLARLSRPSAPSN
jgi:hypothetical protein